MDGTIKDFEAAIAELEAIVKKLEEGDLPLEKSLALYERGVQLSRFCHARLEEAERRIEILNERGELQPAPPALADPRPDEDGGDRPATSGPTRSGVGDTRRSAEEYLRARRELVDAALERFLPAPPALPRGHRRGDALQPVRRRQAPAPDPGARLGRSRSPADPAITTAIGAALALPAACALELIHTYSLVHDDLPAMDDDTLRRGRPTRHVVLRGGDGDPRRRRPADRGVRAARPRTRTPRASRRSRRAHAPHGRRDRRGRRGARHGRRPGDRPRRRSARRAWRSTPTALRDMHARKTGALIRASAIAGAIMAGGTDQAIEAIRRYGAALGLAFQIVDDILDVEGATRRSRQDGGQGRGGRQAHLPRALGARRVAPPGRRGDGRRPRRRSPPPACAPAGSRDRQVGRWTRHS